MGGRLHGGIWAKATLTVSDQFTEYKTDYATQKRVACSASYGPTRLPNPTTIGFYIQVPDPASGEANPPVAGDRPGVANPTDNNCNTTINGHPPNDKIVQTAPLSRLLSTGPQTYTFTQSVHLDQDSLGRPASIDYDWTYSITVQRI